jgi:3-methyladenine DNA glycosylase AlkD
VKDSERDWEEDLSQLLRTIEDGHIRWWNTADWLAVRVLGRMITHFGGPAAKKISSWEKSENLWARRLSLVAFVNHARKGEASFRGCESLVRSAAAKLVRSPERFHQTAVGWVMREVGKRDPGELKDFIRSHLQYFSAEGFRYAVEKLPATQRKREFYRK